MNDSHAWPAFEEVIGDIRACLDQTQVLGCLAHKDADADSLGSALGFAHAMRALGKTVHVMVPSPYPRLLEYLPGFETIQADPAPVNLLFTFDCATAARFGELQPLLAQAKTVVNVDHHATSEGFGTVNLVDPGASATGQVVFKLLAALEAPLDKDIATNLYAALFTDTGGFRNENTDETVLQLGAKLLGYGVDGGWVAQKCYRSRSVARVRLEGIATSNIETRNDGAIVFAEVTQAMLSETGADMQEAEGIIDHLQSVDSMKIAVLFKEVGPGLTKISVRTRDAIDATEICTPFGGGGHRRAAGAEINKPLSEAKPAVLQVAERLLGARV